MMKYPLMRPAAAALVALLGLAEARAATYYVSPSGSDAAAGSDAQPLKTIAFAYARAVGGDVIIVKPGIYTEHKAGYGLHLDRSGSAGAPITLRSQFRRQAVLDGQNVASHGHSIYLTGSHHIIEGFEMKNAFLGGITIYGSYNEIKDNHIHHNGNTGDLASSFGQDGIFSNSTTRGTRYIGNTIDHNGRISINSNLDHGLYLCGDDELVINNVVTHNSAYGLQLAGYDTQSNLKAFNNVFAFNGRSGAALWKSFSGVLLKNNIFYKNAVFGIDSYMAHGSGVVFDRNLLFGNPAGTIRTSNLDGNGSAASDYTFTMGVNLQGDPLFMNDASDYRLRSGSPAINAGATLAEVTKDLEGISRPQGSAYDIGAHEFVSGAPPPPPPPPPPSPVPSSISVSPAQAFPGGALSVTLTGGSADPTQWAALYVSTAPDAALSYKGNWKYFNGQQTAPTSAFPTPVTLTFTAPSEPGIYNLRFFANTGAGTRLAVSQNVTVTTAIATDLNGDGVTNITDVQLGANQALGLAACTTGDVNRDDSCTVADVQQIINKALGL